MQMQMKLFDVSGLARACQYETEIGLRKPLVLMLLTLRHSSYTFPESIRT